MDQTSPGRASKPLPAAAPRPKTVEKQQPRDHSTPRETPESVTGRVTPQGDRPPVASTQPRPQPDLEDLTRISPQALASIESDWRRKYRQDVEQGDTVWLDMENDLLNSFMNRFRTNIYLVWDYPAEALRQMQQGTCLLRITISRDGEVQDVRVLESSGFPLLDREAVDSVWQGASYGPLPRAYAHDTLKIMAFFQYGMSNVVQYRKRPGRIY
jgi:protein TonB